MDKSFRKLVTLVLTLAALAGAAAGDDGEPSEIMLDAVSTSFDGKTGMFAFHGLRMTYGELNLQADEALATGRDSEQSKWQFSGNVRITSDSAVLEADSATFTFEAHQLAMAELVGSPAIFTELSPSREKPARGSANRLSYNYAEHTVRLSENARLSVGPNEVTGCDLIYDLDGGGFTSGSSNCSERVRITILPPEKVATEPPSTQ